jgi:hypothetical protein
MILLIKGYGVAARWTQAPNPNRRTVITSLAFIEHRLSTHQGHHHASFPNFLWT